MLIPKPSSYAYESLEYPNIRNLQSKACIFCLQFGCTPGSEDETLLFLVDTSP
jgi:hypothetical protein